MRRRLGIVGLVVAIVLVATLAVLAPGDDQAADRRAAAPATDAQVVDGTLDPTGPPTSIEAVPGSAPTLGSAGGGPGAPPPRSAGGGDELVALRDPVRCPSAGEPTTGGFPGPDDRDGYRWRIVGELSGRCDRQSGPFRITNADTRLTWRSDASSIAVFLLDPAEPGGLSGYAQTVCSGPCAGSMVLVDKDIDVVLRVQAGDAPWSVRVEQYVR